MATNAALVIGNSAYQSVSELPNPRRDAAAIADALTRQGFDVVRMDDLNRNDMYDALRAFRDKADEADIALIYYAGHGIEIEGRNYLVPVDAELVDERDAPVEMIHVDALLRQMSGARSMKMLVLDACRNNPFVARMQREDAGRNVGSGLANIEYAEADTLIAYAAAAGEITPDGVAGGNSPFTRAFLNAIDGPPQDVRRLLGAVRDEMRQSVPGAAPFVYSSIGGREYVINPNSEPLVQPEPEPEPEPAPQATFDLATATTTILADFAIADRLGTAEAWDGFLAQYATLNFHVLYSLALEKRQAIEAATDRRGLQMVGQDAAIAAQPPAGAAPRDDTPPARDDRIATLAEPRPEAPRIQTPARAEPAPLPEAAPEPVPDVSAAPQPDPEPEPEMTYDEAVRALQVDLRRRGCYRGAIDGIYGRGSSSGIERLSDVIGERIVLARRPDVVALESTLALLERHPDADCPQVAAVSRPAPRKATQPAPVRRKTTAPAPAPKPKPAAPAPAKSSRPKFCPDYGVTRGCRNGTPIGD
ncbi:caspase family protein [Arenibacterium halophilum]|uniref:Caspase family protein n=1 Tax=Arenibacterium halophilum TaxID=2583821 RepID=A0ABY2X9P3_9RHOB|nr:caspase family protein [Arenibacterium halophilum]TMV12684.1 caspase family protein [Arenibacterium halophilum]